MCGSLVVYPEGGPAEILKIFVAKILQKKYNESILCKINKKDGVYMNNCFNFIYSACPEPVRFRNIQHPVDLELFGLERIETAGDGWERR